MNIMKYKLYYYISKMEYNYVNSVKSLGLDRMFDSLG